MEVELSHKRRRYGAQLKAKILPECNVPGASAAKVAMSHGINANILHGWRKLAREAAAAIMSLVHSARHNPYAYLRDILKRLPTQPASHIDELLPHRWLPTATT